MLNNALHPTGGIANDSTVAVWVIKVGGENCRSGLCFIMRNNQLHQGATRQQWGIAGQHDQRCIREHRPPAVEVFEGNAHGMPGAKLLRLHHDQSPRRDLSNMFDDLLAPVTNNHYQVLGLQSGRGFDDMAKQ